MIEQYTNKIGALVGDMEQKDINQAKANLRQADTKMIFKSNWFTPALN